MKTRQIGQISRISRIGLIWVTVGGLAAGALAHAQTVRDVTTGTDGMLVSPANLWTANAGDIEAALSLGNISGTLPATKGGTGAGALGATLSVTSGTLGVVTGTAAGTVAAGNDSRIVGAIQNNGTANGLTLIGALNAAVLRTSEAQIQLGNQASAPFANSIAIGKNATAGFSYSVALGYGASVSSGVYSAIQLGYGTNSKANTLQFQGHRVVDSDGSIPIERLSNAVPATRLLGTGTLTVPTTGTVALVAQYPTFTIPLGGNYTDFELKATTVNYVGGAMVYFYHSPDPQKSAIPQQIWTNRPDVFFTDSQYVKPGYPEENQRAWRRQSTTQSIAAMRTNGNSRISAAIITVRDLGTINPGNAALVWSYCRMTSTGYEEDPGGKSIWTPIVPTWINQPINP